MSLQKEYKTTTEQNEILESRGMIIDDNKILSRINYSHLIYKYGKLYEENPDDTTPTYKQNTKLSYLYNLFMFNNAISKELYEAIGIIETKLKTAIAKVLSKIDPLFHINLKIPHISNKIELIGFKVNLSKIESRKIKDIDQKYLINGHLPIWLLVDELALGQLRMLMKFSGNNNQTKILSKIGLYNPRDWKKLVLVNKYRNMTHHYNPIRKNPSKNNNTYSLIGLLRVIKIIAPKNYKTILKKIKKFKYKRINIKRNDFLDYLGIKSLF